MHKTLSTLILTGLIASLPLSVIADNGSAIVKVSASHFFSYHDKSVVVDTLLGRINIFDGKRHEDEISFSGGKFLKFDGDITDYFFLPANAKASLLVLRVNDGTRDEACNLHYYLVDLTRSEPLRPMKLDAACFDSSNLIAKVYQEGSKIVVRFDSSISDNQKLRQPGATYFYENGELKVELGKLRK